MDSAQLNITFDYENTPEALETLASTADTIDSITITYLQTRTRKQVLDTIRKILQRCRSCKLRLSNLIVLDSIGDVLHTLDISDINATNVNKFVPAVQHSKIKTLSFSTNHHYTAEVVKNPNITTLEIRYTSSEFSAYALKLVMLLRANKTLQTLNINAYSGTIDNDIAVEFFSNQLSLKSLITSFLTFEHVGIAFACNTKLTHIEFASAGNYDNKIAASAFSLNTTLRHFDIDPYDVVRVDKLITAIYDTNYTITHIGSSISAKTYQFIARNKELTPNRVNKKTIDLALILSKHLPPYVIMHIQDYANDSLNHFYRLKRINTITTIWRHINQHV